MDKESDCEDPGGQKKDEENEYEDDEDSKNKNVGEDTDEDDLKNEEYIKSGKRNKSEGEEDIKNKNENKNKSEEDHRNEKESQNQVKSGEEGESNTKRENNDRLGKTKPSKRKRKLSFLSVFDEKSDEGLESNSQESENWQESSEEGRRGRSSKKNRKSSLGYLFSLKSPDADEGKQSGSDKAGGSSKGGESESKLEHQDSRKTEQPEKSRDVEHKTAARKPSYMRKKFLALEMELNVENVYKKVANIFSPDQEMTSDEDSKTSVSEPRRVYLSSAFAAIFIVGSSTGAAIAGLAFFLMQSSWYGVFLILLLGFNAIYAGLCTGWSWIIMENIWPEYLDFSRVPYQDIAYRAVGTWMKYIVAIFVDVTLLVTCACYIVFMADAVGRTTGNNYIICYTTIVLVILLMPFSLYGSYSNMKYIGLIDVIFSVSYTVLTIISIFLDKPSHRPVVYSDPTFSSFVIAFAGMSFGYGVGAVMPNIMVELADRKMFTGVCVTAYMIILAMYITLSILGYAAYGDETPTAILHNIYHNKKLNNFAIFIDCVNLIQLATTFLCALMPTMLSFEDRLNCPNQFCIFRVCIRLMLLFLLMILVLGVPFIPRFMVFIGATTMNILTFILPPIFYVCLLYKKASKSKRSEMSKREWFLITEIVLLGLVIGVISMYIFVDHFMQSNVRLATCFTNMSVSLPAERDRIL